MKKVIISFNIMMACLLSTVSVFATYTDVQDSQGYMQNTTNYATAYLKGRRDDSTDRLSNVTTSKTEKGLVTATFVSVTRPSQYSAKATVDFKYNGTIKSTAYLSI